MVREFLIDKRRENVSKGAILDIPHLGLLKYRTPQEFVNMFKADWGVMPESVSLPLTAPDGLLYPVKSLRQSLSIFSRPSNEIVDFQDVVGKFSKLGLGIYLSFQPRLSFIRADQLHVQDINGVGSPLLCIGKPLNQEIMAAIIGTGVDLVNETTNSTKGGKLLGVIFNSLHLWGMSAKNQRLHLTCFCDSCRAFFNEHKPGILKHFYNFPNPWNLLLRENPGAIEYVDDVSSDTSEDSIVGISRQRGYCDVYKNQPNSYLLSEAGVLMNYLRLRHRQTVFSINQIFYQAFDGLQSVPKRIILLEGEKYGWTTGMFLESLDSPPDVNTLGLDNLPTFDELWINPAAASVDLKHIQFRWYLWKRSRYYIDALFDTSSDLCDPTTLATTPLGYLSAQKKMALLETRLRQAIAMSLTGESNLVTLPDLAPQGCESKRVGFIGVGLDNDLGSRFIDSLNILEGPISGNGTQSLIDAGPLSFSNSRIQDIIAQILTQSGSPSDLDREAE